MASKKERGGETNWASPHDQDRNASVKHKAAPLPDPILRATLYIHARWVMACAYRSGWVSGADVAASGSGPPGQCDLPGVPGEHRNRNARPVRRRCGDWENA